MKNKLSEGLLLFCLFIVGSFCYALMALLTALGEPITLGSTIFFSIALAVIGTVFFVWGLVSEE